ncbi:MAG: VWA domain-containing protein [Candidatus Acidiferrales bacterium]
MPLNFAGRASALLLAAVVAVPLLSFARPNSQQPQEPQRPEQDQPIRVQAKLVNLFLTVRDDKKRLVPDLTREQLRVFEEGDEQKIEFFRREVNLPITLGLLIDTSISELRTLPAEQEAANRFLRRILRPKDLAMVITFDVDVDLLSDFTSDLDRLERAVNRAKVNSPGTMINPGPFPPHLRGGGTNLYDAIYLACTEKLAREAGRKALVVITDAYDSGSKISDKKAVEVCQRADTVIHFILIADPEYPRDPGTARKFAGETGGRVMEPRNEEKLEEAFDQIAEELRSQYIIGYTPPSDGEGGFRKVKVESTRKGMKILTRKGYYAPEG